MSLDRGTCAPYSFSSNPKFLPSYRYYTAGTSGTFDNQRTHVLVGSESTIWESSWSYAGRITIPGRDVWAIDSTVLVHPSGNYLIYSSWDGPSAYLISTRSLVTVQLSCTLSSHRPMSLDLATAYSNNRRCNYQDINTHTILGDRWPKRQRGTCCDLSRRTHLDRLLCILLHWNGIQPWAPGADGERPPQRKLMDKIRQSGIHVGKRVCHITQP